MELQDNRSEIAKLVWAKLKYTECVIGGENTTVIEIKEPWELIKELDNIYNITKDALDFNVKQNIGLMKVNHKLSEKLKSKTNNATAYNDGYGVGYSDAKHDMLNNK
jgi:hypothetical protein